MKADSESWRAALPHRGEALFLDRLVGLEAGSVTFAARVEPGSPYVRAGFVPTVVAIDMAAQAAAVLEHLHGGEETISGYLVGVQSAEVLEGSFPAGTEVVVRAERAFSRPPLFAYRGHAECQGRLLLRLEFSIVADRDSQSA